MFNWSSLRINDPDLINLRRAIRALLIAPTIFVVSDQVFDQPLFGVIGFLAGFVFLVFADFGGSMKSRAIAYTALVLLTTAALAIGSLVIDTVGGAAVIMFAIMFIVSFASIYGGYAPVFVAPIALAYSFAVFLPLESIGMAERLIGWSFGGIAASIAALVVWPINSRADLRQLLASTASDLRRSIVGTDGDGRDALQDARAKILEAREKTSAQLRPAGFASRDVALLHLLTNLEHASDLVEKVVDRPLSQNDLALREQTAAVLQEASKTLDGVRKASALADAMGLLDKSRLDRREKIADRAAEKDVTSFEELYNCFPWLALSHLTLWIAADAGVAMGLQLKLGHMASAPEVSVSTKASQTAFGRVKSLAAAQLNLDGVVFRNSIRMAVAMTLGVVLAKVAPIDHGFWITLGILSVLRSSAQSTSVSGLQAVAGTFAGFFVAAGLLLFAGADTKLLLWLVPPITFFAAYAPGAIGFAVGQVSFTTMVVILFNLVQPSGVETAVIRLETIIVGAVSATAVALILWPRGARAALAHAVANVYRVAAEGLHVSLTGSEADRHAADLRLLSARQKSHTAFAVALGEHGEPIDAQAWGTLLRATTMEQSILAGLLRPLPKNFPEECKEAALAVLDQCEKASTLLRSIADDLDSGQKEAFHTPNNQPRDLTPKLERCLDACAEVSKTSVVDALIIATWNHWLTELDQVIFRSKPALSTVANAAAPHAWLRWSAATQKA